MGHEVAPSSPQGTVARVHALPLVPHSYPSLQPVVLSAVQPEPQAVALAQVKLPGQGAVWVPFTQAPAPLQDPEEVRTSLLQVMALPQATPALAGRHFPFSPPVLTAAQAMQPPVHALSQQTPSTHCPDPH